MVQRMVDDVGLRIVGMYAVTGYRYGRNRDGKLYWHMVESP